MAEYDYKLFKKGDEYIRVSTEEGKIREQTQKWTTSKDIRYLKASSRGS